MIDVQEHWGLVGWTYGKYFRWADRRRFFEDLYQAGCIGLLEARDKFDESRGVKFSVYAVYWIRVRMSQAYKDLVSPGVQEVEYDDSLRHTNGAAKKRSSVELGFSIALSEGLLSEKEIAIMKQRVGWDGSGERTLEQLAAAWGISTESVRQSCIRVIDVLKRLAPYWKGGVLKGKMGNASPTATGMLAKDSGVLV